MSVVKNKSVFYKILLSYILVSIVPLLILGTIFYYMNITNLQKEVMETNLSKLTQVKEQIDFNLMKLEDITMHVSSNPNIFTDAPRDVQKKLSDIIPQLQAYIDNNSILSDILLYQRGDENIYLSDREYHYSVFGRQVKSNLNWTQANFFSSLNMISFPTFKRIDVNEGFPENERLIAYMFPVPVLSTPYRGTIAYLVKESALKEIIVNYLGDIQGYVYMFDSNYNVLLSNSSGVDNAGKEKMESSLRFSKGTGVFHAKLGERKYTVMRIVSKDTGWSYVVAMPESSFYERVSSMRNFIIITIIMLGLVGILLALVISINNYKPVKMLLSHITDQMSQVANEKGKNEFDLIRNTFDTTFSRNQELIFQVDTQRSLVKDQCLIKILRGKIKDSNELEHMLNCSNIQLHGAVNFVLLISIQHIRNCSMDNIDNVLKYIEDIYIPGGRSYGAELAQDKGIAVIVSLNETETEIKAIQLSIAQSIDVYLKDNLGWKPVIGVGNLYRDILQLNTSFLEASAALYDNMANKNTNIHFFSDINKSQGQVYWYPINEQAILIQSLKQGDKAAAMSTINTIAEKIAKGTTSYLMVRCLCYDIINNIIKTINQMNLENFEKEIKSIVEFTTLEDFKTNLMDFAVSFCEYIEKFKEARTNELKNNVIRYVNENFKDSNLSLELLAEKFNTTATYISKFFKEETGYNFIEFVANMRMDEVKLQLRSSNKPIKDIIREVGYMDSASFVRKFKSIENITPGQYRSMSLQPK